MRTSLLAVCAALATLFACEKKTQTPPAEPAKAPVEKPTEAAPPSDTILLGEVGSLTGSEAAFGISTRNGIELAIEEANAAGGVKGKKLAVRVYDDQSKPEEAGSAATRLVTQD